MPMNAEWHYHLVALLQAGKHILVFTGAGISTGSGIPDYRGPQGVWKRRQPVYYQDFMASDAARIEYWDFKLEGWAAFRDAEPNATHIAVAELERVGKIELVVTQNIDSLHLLAGTSRERLVELHGKDREVECQSCHARSEPAPHFEAFARTRKPPICAGCGGLLKAATISFGQQLHEEDLERAVRGAQAADLVLALGSTLSVTPAANIPLLAAERGVPYVIVNRGQTAHDEHAGVTLRLDGDVAEIFPAAVAAACSAWPKKTEGQ
jgi:NAD-dependent deacetylase